MEENKMSQKRYGDWMQTYTGRQFWPLDPRPAEVHLEDIAHALSMTCRYGGHTSRFYSVAEHSVLISQVVPPEDALWGLLHDAAEAYVGDLVRPLKRHLTSFMGAENVVMGAICQRFNLPPTCPASVREADNRILHDERRALMVGEVDNHLAWGLSGVMLNVHIRALCPARAKLEFLARFDELTRSAFVAELTR